MTISQILETPNKKMNPSVKLKAIKKIVKAARESYGNTDIEIDTAPVNSCVGRVQIQYVSEKDKLALIKTAVEDIRVRAMEATECTTGIVFDKKVEELVAINPILCNIGKTTESSII